MQTSGNLIISLMLLTGSFSSVEFPKNDINCNALIINSNKLIEFQWCLIKTGIPVSSSLNNILCVCLSSGPENIIQINYCLGFTPFNK